MRLQSFLYSIVLVSMHISLVGQTRIEVAGSPDFTVSNAMSLATSGTTRMFFKNGSYYTGGIATIGTSGNTARLSLFTQASADRNMMVERLSILNNGYVGIGTNDAQYQMHVKAPSGIGFGITQESANGQAKVGFWTNNTQAYVQTHNNVPLYFATNNGSAQMTLSTTGRIGIGTTTPTTRLDVNGKAMITQQVGDDAALELNGALKVSGSNPAVFVATVTSPDKYIIDHPTANGNPDAMIFVTSRISPEFINGTYSVTYDGVLLKWVIVPTGHKVLSVYDDSFMKCNGSCTGTINVPNVIPNAFPVGGQFNVMIIDK